VDLTEKRRNGLTLIVRTRRRRVVDNEAFAAFVGRIMRAYARRIEGGDIEGLADMHKLAGELRELTGETVRRLVETEGYSWADIGRVLGIKRQSAHEMYARRRVVATSGSEVATRAVG